MPAKLLLVEAKTKSPRARTNPGLRQSRMKGSKPGTGAKKDQCPEEPAPDYVKVTNALNAHYAKIMKDLRKHPASKARRKSALVAFYLIGQRDALLRVFRNNCEKLGAPKARPKDRLFIGQYTAVVVPMFRIVESKQANKAIILGRQKLKKDLETAGSKDLMLKLPTKSIKVENILKWGKAPQGKKAGAKKKKGPK